jgi:hypothetical protein
LLLPFEDVARIELEQGGVLGPDESEGASVQTGSEQHHLRALPRRACQQVVEETGSDDDAAQQGSASKIR